MGKLALLPDSVRLANVKSIKNMPWINAGKVCRLQQKYQRCLYNYILL
jgi:hypothetical protein